MAKFVLSAFSDEAAADINEQIEACKVNGISRIEIRGVNGRNISKFSVDDAKELKKILDKGGIKVATIGSPYGKIGIKEPFGSHFEDFKKTVAVAGVLEAEYIRIFSFYFNEDESYEEYKQEVFRRVREMAEYSDKFGIRCCHENEKGIFGDIPERCLELHKAVGEKLGGIFDTANYIQCGVETLSAFKMLEEYIDYLHVKDALSKDGTVVPAGMGDGRLEEIMRIFTKKQGVRLLCVEPHLSVFKGLEGLEKNNETIKEIEKDKYKYPDKKSAFKAAVDAAKTLVEKVQPVKVGIIGVGNMGTSHVRNYCKGTFEEARVVACADINPAKFARIIDLLPEIKCFNTAEELIDSGECDAVIVATPHYLHPPIAAYALKKGLHVLIEKPAGVYTKQVREMNEVAAKCNRTFAIMYNQRTNHIYRKLREMVQSGEYGEMKRVNWIITSWYRTQAYYNSGGWRATWSGEGGGVLLNQSPHNLDLWQWICGMPSKIHAVCHEGKWHDIEVEDDVTIYAEYPNGATGIFITTTGDAPGTNRLEVTLDRAKIVCESNKLTVYKLDCSTKEHLENNPDGFASPKYEVFEPETDGKNEQHIGVTNAFIANILRGEPLVARGEEGINGLTISNAAHLSYWLGKDIEIPFDEDLFYSELQKRIASSKSKGEVVETVAEDMSASFK